MKIARDIREFVNEALSGIELSDDQKQLYPRYLRKLIMVMCYNQVSCFPACEQRFWRVCLATNPIRKTISWSAAALSRSLSRSKTWGMIIVTRSRSTRSSGTVRLSVAFTRDLIGRAASHGGVSVRGRQGRLSQ